jgi:hypothetical protein
MDIEEIVIGGASIVFYFALSGMLISAFDSRTKKNKALKKYFKGVSSILARVTNKQEAISQINIIYKKLSEDHPIIRKKNINSLDF